VDDAAMSRAINKPYRPKVALPFSSGVGLKPGSTPEGIVTDAWGNQIPCCPGAPTANFPNTPPVPAPGAGFGGSLPSPVKTEEIDQDEFRVPGIGTAVGPGMVTILAAQLSNDIEVLEMNFCALGATNLQIFRDGVSPISANYPLAQNEKWSAPGLTVLRQQAISIFISAAVSVTFEVRWKWRTNAP